ncbi:MAG: Trm112 family protein [Gammaproteobacteria bacterium]
MTIDRKLAELLRCPATHQPVSLAPASRLKAINQAIEEGSLKHLDGRPVEHPLQGALVTEDGSRIYPVRDEIPVMLEDECIAAGPQAAGEG